MGIKTKGFDELIESLEDLEEMFESGLTITCCKDEIKEKVIDEIKEMTGLDFK